MRGLDACQYHGHIHTYITDDRREMSTNEHMSDTVAEFTVEAFSIAYPNSSDGFVLTLPTRP
jgi:hypothetical protein